MSKRQLWTDTERATLRAMYPDHSAAECALALGRTPFAIHMKANALGLRKSLEWIAKRSREQALRPDHGGRQAHFKPGQKAWNDGKSYQPGGRSIETRFQPGRPPQSAKNYRPIGSVRMCRDGYLERKVSDDPSKQPARRWVAAHRLAWEAHNGPVPAGYIVRFKPGMATTEESELTIDRLELVSRAYNMAQNSIHNYPVPIKSLIRAVKRAERALEQRSE